MTRIRRAVLWSCLLLFPAALLEAAGNNTPTLQLSARSVSVANLTPGAAVAIFALALDPNGYESTVVRWSAVVTDTARAGAVTYDAGRDIPRKSIWAAVDLTDGQYVIAVPDGMPLRRKQWPAKPFHAGDGGEIDRIRLHSPFIDALYVHPGKGAWTLRAHDGDTTDGDGKPDGFSTALLGSAQPLGSGTAAPHLVPGGVLIVIDLYHLDVTAVRLDGPALQELF